MNIILSVLIEKLLSTFMEQQQSCQREKSSSVDQNYQKKWLKLPDQIDTVHVITTVCSFSNYLHKNWQTGILTAWIIQYIPSFIDIIWTSGALFPVLTSFHLLFLDPWESPSALHSRSGPIDVTKTALKQWHHRCACMSTREAEESEWETRIVISTSSRAKTSMSSGSVHLDNRLQVGVFLCAVRRVSDLVCLLSWYLGSDECMNAHRIYRVVRAMENRTEQTGFFFLLISTEHFSPEQTASQRNNCESALSKHLRKQQHLGTFYVRIRSASEHRRLADGDQPAATYASQ